MLDVVMIMKAATQAAVEVAIIAIPKATKTSKCRKCSSSREGENTQPQTANI